MKQVCKNCLQIWILLKIALNLIYKTFYFKIFILSTLLCIMAIKGN